MLKNTFCSSPWFHVKLTYDGSFRMCRWGQEQKNNHTPSLSSHSIIQYYNSDQLKALRQELINGKAPAHCKECYYQDSFNKLSGRNRQLNKSAISVNEFELTARSSPHYDNFKFSLENNGLADLSVADLQIDLGNTCNSACIMCDPSASSRLLTDYKKLNKHHPILFSNIQEYQSWTRNPALVQSLVDQFKDLKRLKYVHFLGGETLYDPAFYQICDQLLAADQAKDIIVGTTTNGTLFNDRIEKYISGFKEFHLGISIEAVTNLNDYVRYPSQIDQVLTNIKKFLQLRETNPGLYISLRITPNVFTVYDIDQLFEFMIEHNVIAESCNILSNPKQLRMELVPDNIRVEIQTKIKALIDRYHLSKSNIVNVRRSDSINQVIADVIVDYYEFVCNYTVPADIEQSRKELITFIQAFESIRGNTILDYVPRYEEFLRTYGY